MRDGIYLAMLGIMQIAIGSFQLTQPLDGAVLLGLLGALCHYLGELHFEAEKESNKNAVKSESVKVMEGCLFLIFFGIIPLASIFALANFKPSNGLLGLTGGFLNFSLLIIVLLLLSYIGKNYFKIKTIDLKPIIFYELLAIVSAIAIVFILGDNGSLGSVYYKLFGIVGYFLAISLIVGLYSRVVFKSDKNNLNEQQHKEGGVASVLCEPKVKAKTEEMKDSPAHK